MEINLLLLRICFLVGWQPWWQNNKPIAYRKTERRGIYS